MSALDDVRTDIAHMTINRLEEAVRELDGQCGDLHNQNVQLRETLDTMRQTVGGVMSAEQLANLVGLVRARHKIEAIKLIRAVFNLPLRESKDLVDRMALGDSTDT